MPRDDEPHLARDCIPGRDLEVLPRIEFLDTEAAVLPKHHERPVAANPDLIGVRIRYPQRQTQRIARGDLFGQPRKGNIHKARRMEMRVDKPREAFAVGQHDAPDAARGIRPVVRRFDQHLVSCEARIVIAELPLVRTVTDIGLAVGLAARIERIFGRNGVTVAENHRTAVGLGGDGGGGGGEGDGPGGGGLNDVYMGQVMLAVRPNWSFTSATRLNLVCVVRVKVNLQGEVEKVDVTQSSGNAQYDSSAANAIWRTSRAGAFPPPPSEQYTELDLVFTLNELMGR